ncbi:hypothetical protein Btru_057558 [Bulinus truncatus]|nr:hypothetical protein Btru_057558 [Bulinus truncatus]
MTTILGVLQCQVNKAMKDEMKTCKCKSEDANVEFKKGEEELAPKNHRMAEPQNMRSCLPDICSRHLSPNPKERAWDIMSPRLTLTDEDHHKIVDLSSTIPVSDIIFVSATSDNHFDETQAMVHSLHTVVYPRVQNMTFVLFDIGLTAEQHDKTAKACRCLLIKFPFEKFPSFFKDLSTYTWKPVTIKASMLKARRLVVYQDSSVSWNNTVQELLDRGERLGLQLWGADIMHNIPVTTLKGTFDYFGDQPCAYLNYTSLQAGFGVYKQTSFVVRTILEPWAKCALERDCLIPGVTNQSIIQT